MKEVHAKVKKYYEGRSVLDLDIRFEPGLLYAILGPNGSGKSTLLRILSQVEPPDAGAVEFRNGSELLARDLKLRRRIVLVPDRKGLFNDTVMHNVTYGLKIRKVGRNRVEEAAERAIRAVGLWDLKKTNALRLSNGEAQRLCLAMALAVDPEFVLLDEPTASLDPENAAIVEEIIQGMKQQTKLVLLVTHNIFQAKRLADRVVLLFQGKVAEMAPTTSFFKNPESDLAKRYISGEMIY